MGRYLEVYFNSEMDNFILRIKAEYVYSVEIEDGFIKIFDRNENALHCYRMDNVLHYHIPDEIFGKAL